MEQAELREWERRCVQEETPRCAAACPLHVDARTFCGLAEKGRWDKAWSVLARTLPLPGVLARLCEGPCRAECVRRDAGGAVDMPALERFCAGVAKPVSPPRPLPSRGKSVAVVGASMAGLAAAWELARRGFAVSLHCDVPGGALLSLPEDRIPYGALDVELENLRRLKVEVHAGLTANAELVRELRDTHDAVFVDPESLSPDELGCGMPDDLTLGTEFSGVFMGLPGESSFILQAAFGRRAANSIERFTQGVSMTAGRDHEGPYPSRLYTSLEGVAEAAPVPVTDEASARKEGARCIRCECMECVKHCVFLQNFKSYPKVYVRRIYNNESIVMGTRQANTMINSCMLCGLCETVCPEDFSMAEVCLEARRSMVDRGRMPASAHEFALRDMAFANGEKCALARHAPGHDSSEYVYFPGCQLTASDPGSVRAAYDDLRSRLGKVGLMLRCCNAPAHWAGRESLFRESMDALRHDWDFLGRPVIIAACPTCLQMLRDNLPEAEIQSHWAILRVLGPPRGADRCSVSLAVNDPCAARHDAPQREDVRAVLEQLGVETVDPALTGEMTECCGYGGLLAEANPELGMAAAEHRSRAASQDFVTYCAMCRDMFARAGKRAMHVYDLLYPCGDDSAQRPAPGYSARRENRARLRESLLMELWGGSAREREPFEDVVVAFTPEVSRLMEERRILQSDVQKVLLATGRSGKRFRNRKTGRFLAFHRPVAVTYWVEYEELETGYLVHRTWCHRMRLPGGDA
ncbi:pyridine nucleotide-disulfide oxidoreductase/dicluster-binding protein [Pseudodesulfovibrio tunisiensis]|uniref:pyridine nucleotide-disulfide oxidoreductase/dicluster-binding protein n=1 Tax=Pseudodesulfovibrio tunisiensis TaxID=463192 RepID=UPI001FB49C0D|nr:pyridine nucleotide-disulfide oxidoreductase/dicluster-binding protein [Pseudodesulfovibrio tunisiensis]